MAAGDYHGEGRRVNYTNSGSSTISKGTAVEFNDCIGVAMKDIAAADDGPVELEGIWELAADNSQAFAIGDYLYWDTSNDELQTNTTGGIPAGICVEAKATAGTTAKVKLHQF